MPHLEIVDAHKHNLKNVHLRIPKKKMVVVSGVSGSGKSTLAYDTVFQEGQRKYLESLSSYARQFIKSLERPDVQAIKGIAPTISIDQKHTTFHFNSTVGTISEIAPYLRLLFAKIGQARCPTCHQPVHRYSYQEIVKRIAGDFSGRLMGIFSPVVKNRKGHYQALFEKYRKRGFLKALVNERIEYLDAVPELDRNRRHTIAIQIDALDIGAASRRRLEESLILALNEGNGEILLRGDDRSHFFSNKLHCPDCDIFLAEPQPGTFSFNSPEGACPTCQGTGSADETGDCPFCHGSGLNSQARSFYLRDRNIFELGQMEITELREFFSRLRLNPQEMEISRSLLPQIRQRLDSLVALNLGYISLNRKLNTLSGGELQRTRLVSQIGFSLNGIIYILDEPSIGMHAAEQLNLLAILRQLRENGNTVIVVEHDEETIRAADYVIDMGPGAGERGGRVVFAGPLADFANARDSLTADYVFGRRHIDMEKSPVAARSVQAVDIRGIAIHNIDGLDLKIPLNTLTVVTGVSGSGKSSLIVDAFYQIMKREIEGTPFSQSGIGYREIKSIGNCRRILKVNQSAIGKNSRSCPATYIDVMPLIRELFAGLLEAKMRGYGQNRFSFNVRGGRCEACEGLGYQKLQMSFLPQLEILCPICEGKRYNSETLKVKFKGHSIADVLDLTGQELYSLFENIPPLAKKIRILVDVGLGYLRAGQSSITLSGGESQRIKLTRELARLGQKPTIYILDEPTVGLHFEDIRKLLQVFQALISRGHTVVVIEHNLEIIKTADHVIDLGPGGGRNGGRIIYQGDVAGLINCPTSQTGFHLRRKVSHGL